MVHVAPVFTRTAYTLKCTYNFRTVKIHTHTVHRYRRTQPLQCLHKKHTDTQTEAIDHVDTHRVSSSDMLLKLWLDNVLIWLLLKSLQENTHPHTRTHTYKQRQSVMSHKKIKHLKPTFRVNGNNKRWHSIIIIIIIYSYLQMVIVIYYRFYVLSSNCLCNNSGHTIVQYDT